VRYFEDFAVGDVTELGTVDVSEAEIIEFAERFDPQSFHIDPEAAKDGPFGGLIASGWHTCSVMMGMLVRNLLTGSTSLGSPGIEEIRWLRPVRAGDTLRMYTCVLAKRVSASRPDRGIVTTLWEGLNQADETLITVRSNALFGLRHPQAAAGDV